MTVNYYTYVFIISSCTISFLNLCWIKTKNITLRNSGIKSFVRMLYIFVLLDIYHADFYHPEVKFFFLYVSCDAPKMENQFDYTKRDFIIEKQIAQHFVHYSKCLSNPIPLYATQIIILTQSPQPILKKERNFSQSWNPYTPFYFSSVESFFLYQCLFRHRGGGVKPVWCDFNHY